eukprot:SAG11_NODE_10297_length_841_cov_1.392183_1_plen_118_part_10
MNLLALASLASILGEVTVDMAANMKSEMIGGLLNITLPNTVEVIMMVVALKQNLVGVVQSMLVGSILVNLLLVLGVALIVGGIRYHVQMFLPAAVTVSTGMLVLCCLAMAIPTVYGVI